MHLQGTTYTKQLSLNHFHGPVGGWSGVGPGLRQHILQTNEPCKFRLHCRTRNALWTNGPETASSHIYIQTETWLVELRMILGQNRAILHSIVYICNPINHEEMLKLT